MSAFPLPYAALLVLLAGAAGAQEVAPAKDKSDGAEIPLDFRKLESSAAAAADAISKPAVRPPDGMGPSERSRPSREEPPLPPAPAPEPEASGGLEALPKEDRHGGRGGGHQGGSGPRPDYDLYEEASQAAEWAAEWQVHRSGLPEFYRVGAWRGLQDAFERAMQRSYAFDDGADDGERDPRAERSGRQEGERAALARGERAGRAAVESEFRDLSREPRRAPRPPGEPLPPDLVRVREPRIEDAFADVSLGSYLSYENFDRYTDPWQLYRAGSWGEVYDSDWDSNKRAFEHWRDRGDDAIWDKLSRPEQDYFRRTFADQLDYWRSRELRAHSDDAYREGYDDGWDYGAEVGAELRYRQGYHQGFLAAATAAAAEVWNDLYPEVYGRSYREEYEAWSTSARPEIEDVELFDQNDDGIFEPGEEVRLALELANFGGREVKLELGADGSAIEPAAAARPLQMRRRERATADLRVKIDAGQAPRTQSSFSVRAGTVGKTVPILISRPLELEPRVAFGAISSLDGRASLVATVWNRSTKPAAGVLDLWVGERRLPGKSLEVLAPLSRREIALEADGFEGLGLLEGFAEVRLELKSREVPQDELRQRLPALGLDLKSGEPVRFWLDAVYGERDLSRAEATRLTELFARRMAADWEAQRTASGNPYKEDLQGGARSALGELVSASLAERRPARHPELQKALAARLKALSEKLPGTHPFLRGSFKKLAGKLD